MGKALKILPLFPTIPTSIIWNLVFKFSSSLVKPTCLCSLFILMELSTRLSNVEAKGSFFYYLPFIPKFYYLCLDFFPPNSLILPFSLHRCRPFVRNYKSLILWSSRGFCCPHYQAFFKLLI